MQVHLRIIEQVNNNSPCMFTLQVPDNTNVLQLYLRIKERVGEHILCDIDNTQLDTPTMMIYDFQDYTIESGVHSFRVYNDSTSTFHYCTFDELPLEVLEEQ